MVQQSKTDVFLEGTNLERIGQVDLSVLDDASKYGIDLDKLDVFTQKTPEKKVEKTSLSDDWQHLDVKLTDVVNMVIATSERPVFMVRDDKLVYLNPVAEALLDAGFDKNVLGNNFFNLVAKEDWNLLAENIGEMITNAKTLRIRLKSTTGKIIPMSFQAIYLSDIEKFSFILLGDHIKKTQRPSFNSLYDDVTGLPNFFLFEDRVQVAVSLENSKESSRDLSMILVAAVNIDNLDVFRKMHIEEMVIKKAANNLVLNLPKSATIALGLKYSFWVMIPALKNKVEVNNAARLLFETLSEGVSDNFTKHELLFSVGISVFPQPAHSAKKMIEQALEAIKKAQNNPKSSVEFFVNEKL